MHEWTSNKDVSLLGGETEAARVLALCRSALALEVWDGDCVMRVRLAMTQGHVAWIRTTAKRALLVVMTAPAGHMFDVDMVSRREFFAKPFDKLCMTKSRQEIAKPNKTVPSEWGRFVEGGLCIGILGRDRNPRRAVLCRVESVGEDGALRSVVTISGGDPMSVEDHSATKWFGVTKFEEGMEMLWEDGVLEASNYRLLTIWASQREDPGKAARTRYANKRAAKGLLPEAPDAPTPAKNLARKQPEREPEPGDYSDAQYLTPPKEATIEEIVGWRAKAPPGDPMPWMRRKGESEREFKARLLAWKDRNRSLL